ncbi:lytic murein transglycosylase B [Halioxenophilus aromaticivorans]|uniref:Lytic murein transglycosylase B n=1 Tax=Halioxenophilus aromaticivorans TaxID=1306992 RepID=A0AAV3U158_9ALTE
MKLPIPNRIAKCLLTALATTAVAAANVQADSYQAHPQAKQFIDEMVKEQGFDRGQLEAWFSQAERKDSILEAIARPAERVKSWKDYRKIFVTPTRIEQGVVFWKENADILAKASEQFGVPEEIVVAILGVETRYGAHKGSYRVIDALSTLAFDYPPRSKFFRKELKEFLLLAKEQGKSPMDLTGSYAGAMGYGQFMPSSYRAYAYDFNDDGFTDIWASTTDAIGSIANYFVRHGWKADQPVVVPLKAEAKHDTKLIDDNLKPSRSLSEVTSAGYLPLVKMALPDPVRVIELDGANGNEYWLGMHNFYVITRYNHSTMYALSVFQLGQAVAEAYQAEQGLASTGAEG